MQRELYRAKAAGVTWHDRTKRELRAFAESYGKIIRVLYRIRSHPKHFKQANNRWGRQRQKRNDNNFKRQGTVWAVTTFDIFLRIIYSWGLIHRTQKPTESRSQALQIFPQISSHKHLEANQEEYNQKQSVTTRCIGNHKRAEVRALEFSHLPPATWDTLRVELRMKKEL